MAAERLEFEATIDAASINKYLSDLKNGADGAAKQLNDAFGGTVKKTIAIETQVDTSGAKQLVAVEKERLTVADKIIKLQRQSEATQTGSLTSLRQQYNRQKQLRDSIAKYQEIAVSSGKSVRVINQEWTVASQKVSEVGRKLAEANASGFWDKVKVSFGAQGLVDFLDGLAGITQGLQAASIVVGQFTSAINDVVKTAADLQAFALSFEAIGEGAIGASFALKESERIALGLGTNLATVQDSFRQLSPVVLNTGGSIEDVSGVVEALSSRFAAFGISGDRARRVTNGVIQAFAKGKLQAEELTQQISEADAAFKTDFASALGVSVQELEALVKTGQITSDVLLEVIPQLSKSALLFGKLGSSASDAAASLEQGNVTIDQVRTNFGNLNQLSLRRLAKAFDPVINSFLGLQAVVVDFFTRISRSSNLDSIGNILASIGNAGARLVSVFLSLAEAAISILNAIAPLVEKLVSVPGVLEAIGLAVLGRFLKPLQSGTKVLGGLGGIVVKYFSDIKAALNGAASSVNTYSAAISAAREGVGALSSAARTSSTATQDVGNATKEAGAEIGRLGQNVQQAAKVITDYQSGTSKYIKSAEAAKIASSNLLRSIVNIAGFPRIVSQDSLAGLRELAKKDPATSMALLRNAIGATRRELAGLDKSGPGAIALRANLNDLKSAMVEVVASSKGIQIRTRDFGEANQVAAVKTSLLTRGLNAGKIALSPLTGLFRNAAIGARALAASLGPVGLVLSGIAIVQQAYNNANKDTAAIAERTKSSIEALNEALKEIEGTEVEEGPLTGLALAWERISFFIAEAAGGVIEFFDRLSRGAANSLGSLENIASTLAIIGGGAGIGFALGGPIGAVIGALTGGFTVLLSQGDGVNESIKRQARTIRELKKASIETAGKLKELAAAAREVAAANLDSSSGLVAGDEPRSKLKTAYDAQKAGLADLRAIYSQQKALADKDLRNKEKEAENRLKIGAKLIEAQKELDNFNPVITGIDAADDENLRKKKELQDRVNGLAQAFRNSKANQKAYNDSLYESSAAASATEKELKELQEEVNRTADALGFARTIEADPRLNSIEKIKDQISKLKAEADQLDLLSPESIDRFKQVNAEANALEATLAKISRTDLEIEVEIRGLEQDIAESQIQIALEPGPLRDAALGISSVTNDMANASSELNNTISQLEIAEQKGVINATTKSQLIQEAALKYQAASEKGKANIIDAARSFREQIDQARSRLQGLVLQNQGFFTPSEIRKNAEQIRKDFTDTLNKVRAETGDFTFFPDLGEVKTPEELLAAQKAFVDTRKEADNLQTTLDNLNEALNLLSLVLIKIASNSGIDLGNLGLDPNAIVDSAGQSQAAINGIGAVYNQTEKAALSWANGVEMANGRAIAAYDATKSSLSVLYATEEEAINNASKAWEDYQQQFGESGIDDLSSGTEALQEGVTPTNEIASGMGEAAAEAQNLADIINSLDGKTVSIAVNGVPGLWTGGPTEAGQVYRVNELGQEGFLNAGGILRPINKPKNALWKAPSAGTVIPAHIMQAFNLPTGEIKASNQLPPANGSSNGAQKIAKALQNGLMNLKLGGSSNNELAAIQASQAQQIGKLSHAITELTEKNWNVNVRMNAPGNTVYMNALNRLS